MRTVALVESPAQLLHVVEWACVAGRDTDLSVVVLAPGQEVGRHQLRNMAALARADGLDVVWHEPRQGGAATARTVRSLAGRLNGVDRLVVGDPFSGVLQVVMSISRATEVVIVDDGTATLEFVRQWRSGEQLARWHKVAAAGQRRQISTFARDQISASLRWRLSRESGCRLSVFSCLDLTEASVPVVRHDFGWVRGRFGPPAVRPGVDLVGTSLVETGVVAAEAYVAGVARLASTHGIDRYFAHRREAEPKLAELAGLGLEVVRPDLPLEIVARRGPVGATVLSFPSTVVHTLPQVLRGTGVELVVCDISDDWYVPAAPARSETFLGDVTRSARDRFGLAAVAC